MMSKIIAVQTLFIYRNLLTEKIYIYVHNFFTKLEMTQEQFYKYQ